MKLRAVALLLVVATFGGATQPSSAPPPLHEQARAALRHGDFAAALEIANRGLAKPDAPASRELLLIAKAEATAQSRADEALRILDTMPQPVTPEARVRRLLARGYALTLRAKYELADTAYRDAADLAAHVAPELRPEVLMNWIAPMLRSGRYERVMALAQEAIAGAQRMRQTFVLANAYGMLGLAELSQDRFEAGLEHCEQATGFARAAGAQHTLALIGGNVGWAYFLLGDVDEAKRRFEEAEAAAEAAHILRVQSIWLANIANVYIARREFQAALPVAQRAVAAARAYGDTDLLATALVNAAQVEIEIGRADAARALNDEALLLQGKSKKDDPLALINQARIAHAGGASKAALEMLARVEKSSNEPRVRWQAEAFAAAIYTAMHRRAEARRMYEAALNSGDEARGQIQKADSYLFAFETNLIRFYDEYIDLLLGEGQTVDALRVAERSRARTLREGLGQLKRGKAAARTFDPSALARAHDATILHYWFAPHRSLLWIVTPREVKVVMLPSRMVIEQQIDAYRREIIDRAAGTDSIRGTRLYDTLVAPAVPYIRSPRVIVVPDGHLNSMNLEAAVVPSPSPHYWLQDVTLSYAPALQFLQPEKDANPPSFNRLLLIGNVPSNTPEFPALKRAGTEISTIARHFTRPVILDGPKATPRAYLDSSPGRFNAIHFAAHGTANERAPLESSVILAGGRLSGHEIKEVDLNAQLVTISSCDSAGKRSYQGEGLVGLAWAFLRAGARRVVAAQWDVSDATSPTLMDVMYSEMAKGRDPATALRQAKLAMLRSGGKDARPFNWAPFILYGAP